MGLKGDLSAGEILEQVLHASRVSPIRNVVFMGETWKSTPVTRVHHVLAGDGMVLCEEHRDLSVLACRYSGNAESMSCVAGIPRRVWRRDWRGVD